MPPGIKVTSNGAILKLVTGFKNFSPGKEFLEEAGQAVVESIERNIENQVQADGSQLKRNAPSTMESKRRRRLPQLSLVAQFRRFISKTSSWRVRATKTSVTVEPTSYRGGGKRRLKDLVRWVQEKGYTGWFGIDKKGAAKIKKALKRRIKGVFRRAQ
jgi:hypothetical protein